MDVVAVSISWLLGPHLQKEMQVSSRQKPATNGGSGRLQRIESF
ncbi:hypothetical protein LEMLEM_LOCUS18438 [Lemmus lemmus]